MRLARELPAMLRRWRDAIGSPRAEEIWTQIRDYFLQQMTITNAAYAVLPHLLAGLDRVPIGRRLDYLIDVGAVESARLTNGSPRAPAGLVKSYVAAINAARPFALSMLGRRMTKSNYRWLIGVVCCLHGHPRLGDMLFNLDCIAGDCPEFGVSVYPDEIQDSGYC